MSANDYYNNQGKQYYPPQGQTLLLEVVTPVEIFSNCVHIVVRSPSWSGWILPSTTSASILWWRWRPSSGISPTRWLPTSASSTNRLCVCPRISCKFHLTRRTLIVYRQQPQQSSSSSGGCVARCGAWIGPLCFVDYLRVYQSFHYLMALYFSHRFMFPPYLNSSCGVQHPVSSPSSEDVFRVLGSSNSLNYLRRIFATNCGVLSTGCS
ncbi:uncharacterized protein C8R40DRAFT_412016 [Lentinula edodes]|uniref:uncharacterized protein n=1 Tax=Lentinula edodes TaxID=5353 RepID=UPI001E8D1C91|nr:uncharacterized protein C8R40DRAFT_412016 [Lentinula edodes]KAH7873001.1 hypothetical protein C8R40DRAFT_412016 [Lentinula edodes]